VKRLLVSLVALGVLLSAGSACEVIGSNVAATVDGKDITVDQVTQLARVLEKAQPSKPPLVVTTTQGLNSTAAQKSLAQWIQLIASERTLKRMGSSATSSAKSSASSQLKTITGLSAANKAVLIDGIAALNSLLPKLATNSNPEFHKLAAAALKSVPATERKQLCSQAIYGPATAADQVQALLDGGATLDDPTAFSATGFSAATQEKQLCVAPADLPADLASVYFAAPVGKVEKATFTSQGQDGSPQSDAFFFKILGATTVTINSDLITQEVVQNVQNDPSLLLGPEFKKLAIHVDPRFGSGFDLTKGIISPPASPLVPTTKPKPKAKLVQPSTGGSSTGSAPAGSAPTDSVPAATATPSG
jgi:hypothetical protein